MSPSGAELQESGTSTNYDEVINPLQQGYGNEEDRISHHSHHSKTDESKGATKSFRRSAEINELSEDEGYHDNENEFDSYSLLEEVVCYIQCLFSLFKYAI